MGVSMIETQRGIIIDAIRNTTRGDWMVLVVDVTSRKLIDNVLREDDILNANIRNIEQIEDKRPVDKDVDVIYLLTPEPHIVDCLLADFDRRRYKGAYLLWTSLPHPSQRQRVDHSNSARQQIKVFNVLGVGYYPRESHVVTFRDPWSFPILYHPACNNLVKGHLEDLAQKIVSVCVSLGEYPVIRYYRPRNASHEASVLCSHLARFVQDQIDMYAQFHQDFPPPSNRPRGALYIVDRSMDLMAPFIHEFTYQAMAHDLLPIKEGEKVTYRTLINEGQSDEEEKDMEISEKDRIWVENRHRHMKDTIEKLMGDFRKFIEENPNFTRSDSKNANSLNAIKDMLAGLPEFQEMKAAYSLHLNMAQECMNIFENQKLPDLASVEQSLATGLDEDYKKPKNLADQVVRALDEDSISPSDRLRLVALYLLFKDGLLPSDVALLLAHAQLPPQDREILANLDLLGARVSKSLKDSTPGPPPLFPRVSPGSNSNGEEYALSRFTANLKRMLEEHVRGSLDQNIFPYTRPQADAGDSATQDANSNASLRSAKPTWAKSRLASTEPRQRIIVFMAGGATYSESRACYEVSRVTSRDVFLVTSHMQTPSLFLKQVGDLSVDKRRLKIPAEQPKPKPPAHLFEQDQVLGQPKPQAATALPSSSRQHAGGLPRSPAPPTSAMNNMSLGSGGSSRSQNGGNAAYAATSGSGSGPNKISKEQEKDKKKKHHFFGSSKK